MASGVDVFILGGGPAGAAAALTLRRDAGMAVAIAEKSFYEETRVGDTLSPGVRPLLDHLGMWPVFERAGHLPAWGNSAAWGGAAAQQRDFLLTPFGHGWHLDRRRFDADLAAAAEQRGALVWRGSRLERCERRGEGWRVRLAEQGGGVREVTASFLIDATGKSQTLARRLGARRQVFDRLVALAAELPATADADTFTLVEACRHGWFYSACLPARQGKTWWTALMTDGDLARRHRLGRPEVWWRALAETEHSAKRLAAAGGAPSRILPVAAHSALLPAPAGPGWLAIGDAAASHDPLSSSGIGRAIESGIHAGLLLPRHLDGEATALEPLVDRQLESYRGYLGIWSGYYQIERRWPDEPFWRRRQTTLTLDPRSLLVASPFSPAGEGWPADLRPLEPADLLAFCRSPRRAERIVAEHPRREEVGDRRLVLGLQWLVAGGSLAVVKEA